MKKTFINAQEMHRLHPKTFEVPTEAELDSVEVGDYVKVAVDGDNDMQLPGERFWVEVDKIYPDGSMKGRVNNELLFTKMHGWSDEDVAKVRREEVYSVFKGTPIRDLARVMSN